MNEKTYTVVGTTRTVKSDGSVGPVKVRWANDLTTRIKVLNKTCTEIDLIELPEAMSKLEAIRYFLSIKSENLSSEQIEVLESKINEKQRVAKVSDIRNTLTTGTASVVDNDDEGTVSRESTIGGASVGSTETI